MNAFVEAILGEVGDAVLKGMHKDMTPVSTGISKKECHKKGMEMRRAGKTVFCLPNKDDPKKRDLVRPK